ncbi:MAG TPA: sulfotransferase [Candidatus Omnitrophota bacterium]|nr:sulfotransferase [Candidatus Omnitrophota bacterium]
MVFKLKSVFLHNVLGFFAQHNADILYYLSKIESQSLDKSLKPLSIDRPIYITGMARSGSTVLLDLLSRDSDAASYKYCDYPFVMVPFWWRKFSDLVSKKDEVPQERSHADRLKVTSQSPEAMEEIIWMHFFPHLHDPGQSNLLTSANQNINFNTCYSDAIKKILLSEGKARYLAKNNYNVGRLGYIQSLYPDAKFIILFRNPIWHIASLIKQHKLLSKLETEDEQVLLYMRRSGHFEFGLDRRPMNFGSYEETKAVSDYWDAGNDAAGWAAQWTCVYAHFLKLIDENSDIKKACAVVDYDKLCEAPKDVLRKIYDFAELRASESELNQQASELCAPGYYRPDFSMDELEAASKEIVSVYKKMQSLSI